MNIAKFFIFFIFFIFLSLDFFAQEYLFDVQTINIEQGLPNRRAYNITQDKEGFIWVSTAGKISRYDGYNFKNYNSNFLKTNDSQPNFIAFDDADLLWYVEYPSYSITNESGIIDTKTNIRYEIESFSKGLIKNKSIQAIYPSKIEKGVILILTKDRKFYQYNKGVFRLLLDEFPEEGNLDGVKYYQFEKENIWFTFHEKLWKVGANGMVTKYKLEFEFEKLFEVEGQVFCKVMKGNKIQHFRIENDEFVPIVNDDLSLESNVDILLNDDLYLFVTNKILIKNKAGKVLFLYDDLGIIGDQNKTIGFRSLIDAEGLIWLTTENGIIKITPRKNNFKIVSAKNSIRGITKVNGKLCFGGYFNNEFCNIDNEIFQYLEKVDIAFSGFHQDDNENLWIGTTSNNLLKYDIKRDSFSVYTSAKNPLLVPYFNLLRNQVFIGTENGIVTFDPELDTFLTLKLPIDSDDLSVRQFYDYGKELWVVTNKGLLLMDKKTAEVKAIYDKEFSNLNYLYIDKDDIFWIGTRENGLFRWDRSANKLKVFSRVNGLSNNNVYAIYEDDFNTLWLPTDYGLNNLDKKLFDVKVFLPKDGIAHEEFNSFAHYEDAEGRLYFGGLGGISIFHPKDFMNSSFHPNLKLINLEKAEKDEPFKGGLLKNYLKDKSIKLEHYETSLKISLALLDYAKPNKNQYAYKLDGINQEWIYTENNVIILNNLPSGSYSLLLKAKSATGNLANEVLDISIFKDVPLYEKNWFIISTFLLFLIFIFMLIKWRFSKLEKDRIRLEAEVDKRTKTILEQTEDLKALDKAKTQFFSNITHEFRTPLTLIIGPLEQLLNDEIEAKTRNKLNGIYKNANLLQGLINQLLDLSKIESGNMQVEIMHGDIVSYSRDLVEYFRVIAEQKNQNLIFKSNLESWSTHFDKEKWNKIVFNLLSNAIKFTPEEGTVKLIVEQIKTDNGDIVSLKVVDNGIGIRKDEQENIFQRFYQTDGSTTRIQEGTGIGLALVKDLVSLQSGTVSLESKIGEGSTFSILLPIPEVNYVVNQLDEKTENSIQMMPILEFEETEIVEDSNRLELLIIEDNTEMRSYIRSCIDESIYKITEAENGELGIQYANDLIPDLIISDVMMPKKDGYEVVESIRKEQSTSHIPIILLTAKSSLESRLKAWDLGTDAYLAKPFSPAELTLRIQKLIELRQLFQGKISQEIKLDIGKEALPQVRKLDNTYEKEDAFIKALRQYIESNIEDYNMNGETVAAHFSMSRMQLHRKLKALTDISISSFIKKIRLKKAIELLNSQSLNISEIAYDVGFSSPAQFSKVFKKEIGKTPSQFLETLKKDGEVLQIENNVTN